MNNRNFKLTSLVLCLPLALVLGACGANTPNDSSTKADSVPNGAVTITNCGEQVHYGSTSRLFVNDSNLIADVLALGGESKVVAATKTNHDGELLRQKFGDAAVEALPVIAEETPSLESIIAQKPDIFVAGWSYGLSESKNITPESLSQQGIGTYILSESCRQQGSNARGTVDPWEAVREDIRNLGDIIGDKDKESKVLTDFDSRLSALQSKPQAEKKPVGFIFDSSSDTVFTSGNKGGPAAVVTAAGSDLATASIDDTWVSVPWEQITASAPDYFIFVDYPGQSVEDKVAALESNPATEDLPAVKNHRYIKLRYSMLTSSVLNIDAAENVREALESWNLVPQTGITPALNFAWQV
ncbi:MAG: ABC transporter substrate-binding protein [Corynebacterium sp.]|nr:ABC transporter substrate-binding protein [Corynebacterium sp.]